MYRFDEEDERRLVRIARSIDLPVRAFFTSMDKYASLFHDCLEETRQIQRELTCMSPKNQFVQILPEGEQLFRNYSSLKNLATMTVIFAEAGVAAEKYGLELKIIAPEDIKQAQIAVEQLESYIKYRNEKNKNQIQAIEGLNRIRIDSATYEDLTNRLKQQMTTQTPFAAIGQDRYICFTRQSNPRLSKFILFTKENQFLIEEQTFYDPEFGKGKDYFEEAMK